LAYLLSANSDGVFALALSNSKIVFSRNVANWNGKLFDTPSIFSSLVPAANNYWVANDKNNVYYFDTRKWTASTQFDKVNAIQGWFEKKKTFFFFHRNILFIVELFEANVIYGSNELQFMSTSDFRNSSLWQSGPTIPVIIIILLLLFIIIIIYYYYYLLFKV
jgi:hypothetical protein